MDRSDERHETFEDERAFPVRNLPGATEAMAALKTELLDGMA